MAHRLFAMPVAEAHPLYLKETESKGRAEAELREGIRRLTGCSDD